MFTTLKAGCEFDNVLDLRFAIACVSAEQERRTKNTETKKDKIVVGCAKSTKDNPCPFIVRAKPVVKVVVIGDDDDVHEDLNEADDADDRSFVWRVTSSETTHHCSIDGEGDLKARQKTTPFTPDMFTRFPSIISIVRENPDVAASVLRPAILSCIEMSGLRGAVLPPKFEYKVKERCFRQIFGPRCTWFNVLRPWAESVRNADADNYVEIDFRSVRSEDETLDIYKRAFVCLGACRRFVSVPADVRLVFMTDCGHCFPPYSSGQLAMLSVYDAGMFGVFVPVSTES